MKKETSPANLDLGFSILPKEVFMRFLSIPEFSKSPQAALSSLAESEKIVLTSNGKPTALLDLREQKAKRDLHDLQMQSVKNGNNEMTMDEINAEIMLARQERNAKSSS